jgi:hypothetical protein
MFLLFLIIYFLFFLDCILYQIKFIIWGTALIITDLEKSVLSVHFVVTANFLTNADWYILFLKIDIFGTEILRVTTLLGNASVLGQSGLEHASPLASGGIFSTGGADVNGWTSRFLAEVRILSIGKHLCPVTIQTLGFFFQPLDYLRFF